MSRTMTRDSIVFDVGEKIGREKFERRNWPYILSLGDKLGRALSDIEAERAAESYDGRSHRV